MRIALRSVSHRVGVDLRGFGIPDDGQAFDLSGLRVEVEPSDWQRPIVCCGDRRTRTDRPTLARMQTYIPQYSSVEDCDINAMLFADDGWTVVYWQNSACAFEGLRPEHVEVLRAMASLPTTRAERKDLEIGFKETVFTLSRFQGCHGDHRRPCPPPTSDGAWSLVRADGSVDGARLRRLRA